MIVVFWWQLVLTHNYVHDNQFQHVVQGFYMAHGVVSWVPVDQGVQAQSRVVNVRRCWLWKCWSQMKIEFWSLYVPLLCKGLVCTNGIRPKLVNEMVYAVLLRISMSKKYLIVSLNMQVFSGCFPLNLR